MIQLRNVIKNYSLGEGSVEVLKGVSLEIVPGEIVAIVGASGNGKSTLLNMITGIDRPTAGEVIVHGAAVHAMSEDQLAAWRGEHVGIVFQFFQLLPALNLLQNVILPMDFVQRLPPEQRRARAMQLLERVGLEEQAFKLPSMVSGGQQQRAAIARALANDPSLIVADEPTGNLDSKTSDDVFQLFEALGRQGKTVVLVTHDQGLACDVPRMLEIRNGVIVRDERCQENEAHVDTARPFSATAPGLR